MIIKIFTTIINHFFNSFDDDETYPVTINRPISYPKVNLPFSEEEYPYTSGFFIVYDGVNNNRSALTKEVLDMCSFKEVRDYMIHGEVIYFTTLENKKFYERIGQEIYGCAMAAYNFKSLQKDDMGKIAFAEENKFYITVRPLPNKEKELLKEVTLFFKSHGYAVDHPYFQENFYVYENYSIKFYIKDEAMAAELAFYIEGKSIGVIL